MPTTHAQDRAYANADFIPGGKDYPPRWQAQAAAFRAQVAARARLDVPYGAGAREKFDLFLPERAAPLGLVMFIHGGYWLAFDRKDFSHLAAGALARGWACVLPSYTLAPQARIGQITGQIAAALNAAAGWVEGPIVVAGHSAGGHLAARLGNDGVGGAGAGRMQRVVPISPMAELAPLMDTAMNADLQLDAAECAQESPARLPLRSGLRAHVWVGGQERPAFLWQARCLSEAWNCPWTVAPTRHHFDVIEELAFADSPLMTALLAP